ncbi:hypothetical protein [Paenibacillus sp. J2TS4]|uniref:hypothetical protein n=1 Tax=Paenibacillus sp. J2TS4 TaxID=2807194 RepID=UPI001B00287A|nr:hypothetical protein [Paenibacillus sp. J2TS4]GIP32941.1 hypothetical protein J2TS4_21510 [Paenibacillus sp. J2TS4]
MIRQYFTELTLEEGALLSDGLHMLVDKAEEELASEFIEVVQVVKHDSNRYTVILNIDLDEEASESANAE